MGACSSCDSRSGLSTAKLILQDGQLQEFSGPVKVSQLLQKNPSSFICNSDDMDFDDVVSAVGADEFLQPGQLYFVLPLNRLKRPLTGAEMAELAVRANVALSGSGCEKRGCGGRGLTVVESDFNEVKTGREIGGGDGSRRNVKGKSQNCGGRRRRNTAAVLSAIPE
uniref:Uncharacterized protein n=1 Tax=Kalanchoe fedtschenkoi TaxID=63787 RepID=A0A7N1A198_KALFE